MRGAILAVGDEILLGTRADTNSPWLAEGLAAAAVRPVEIRAVGDDRAAIRHAIVDLCSRGDVLLITGGLGPTDDDLTRFALNDVTDGGVALVPDAAALAHLEEFFALRGRPMPPSNRIQAMRPASARFIPNPVGTAMGLSATHDGVPVFALPGPPGEMKRMFEDHVRRLLPGAEPGRGAVLRSVHELGLGESEAAERLGDMMRRDRHPLVGTTASGGIVTAHVRALGRREEIAPLVEELLERIRSAWSPYAFGTDGVTLAQAVGDELRRRGLFLATAESCTGGWLAKRLVDVEGASSFYRGGWVTYSNDMKESCLGVDAGVLRARGAVSEEVACQMAEGAARSAPADVGVAVTGIAGPSGAVAGKPAGTVFIATALRRSDQVRSRAHRFIFSGDRNVVRGRSVNTALQLVRLALLSDGAPPPLASELVSEART
jgi:nicotinamide-nucleotide amidase